MAQLWGGRFTKETDQMVYQFNASISFDKRFYAQDIRGSIAHVMMLAKQGILTEEEQRKMISGLEGILRDIEDGSLAISEKYEDIHSFVEATLIERIGEPGKKLHTGRSRNDQVALDMKLFTKEEIVKVQAQLLDLLEIINGIAKENISTYMPGFTHLQKAQPVSFSHYILAYAEMFRRDFIRLKNAAALADTSPLGSAALAGTTYPLDRNFTSSILGFSSPTWNSMDSVSDRDYLIEIMNAFALIMVHLSRFCEEIIIYSSNDFGYIELSDSFSTGSSIMPQKKNPDAAELIRGKSGRVFGDLMALLTTMKGIPLAYNKDMQEDKENFFDSLDTVKGCLAVFNGMIHTMTIKKERLLAAAAQGFINATDVADYLTERGMSFRDAYKIVGSMVAYCIDNNTTFEEISINTYKEFSELFEKAETKRNVK